MNTRTQVTALFETTLERAFKTPMLCDVTKVHTGYGPMPKVTHCTEDESWGKPGGSRKVWMAKSPFFEGGEAALDRLLERTENAYWKIEVCNFKVMMLGIERFQGEWATRQLSDGKVLVTYTYTMFSNKHLLYPLQWLFTKIVWRRYMKHVIDNIKKMAIQQEPYVFD